MSNFKTKEALEKRMDTEWRILYYKHPTYGIGYLNDMHDLLDWYEDKLNKIT